MEDTTAEVIELYGPDGKAFGISYNLMQSDAGLTDFTRPGSGGALTPEYSSGRASFLGNIQWLVDLTHSGSTDSFLIELQGRLNDGTTATSWGTLASGTYTASEAEYIDVYNAACNEFRLVGARTGSTDTITLACWLLKNFESDGKML